MSFDIAAVVPTYNRAELLRETLRSILAQSHRPAEVIVVDDGSTDGTAAMIKEFDGSVRYHAIENAGVCRARNIGVSLAKAPWIAFCDSDDLWRPDFLAQHVALLRAAPELSYAFSNFVPVRDNAWGTRSSSIKCRPISGTCRSGQ
jgi:glycosyltransferase involved in cell wall biosynthesis